MDDQASLRNGAVGAAATNGTGTHRGVTEFVLDVLTLAELQTNLAALNFKEAARKAAFPVGLLVLTLTVLAASTIVALIGASLLLASVVAIHPGLAMILTAGVAIIVAGPAAVFSVIRLSSSRDSLRPSGEELKRNLTWLRAILRSQRCVQARRNR
jgi:hypothetical protein